VQINEMELGKMIPLPTREIIRQLNYLHKLSILDYQAMKNEPQITFLTERLSRSSIHIDMKALHDRKQIQAGQLGALLSYARDTKSCRGNKLLAYFGEISDKDCGHCDYCLQNRQKDKARPALLKQLILDRLRESPRPAGELAESISGTSLSEIGALIRELMEEELIYQGPGRRLFAS
jgi:ATP-dependent DNA helicase RecQ